MASALVMTCTDQMLAPEEIGQHALLLVDFWAPWCGPCRMMAPVIDQLADELSGKLAVGKLNIDDYGQAASAYHVVSIPTLILFARGREVERVVGVTSKAQLTQMIARHFENKN